MAVRPCFYIVHDDGTFWRLRKRTFHRIVQQREDEVHPEFKGQRLRYAEIFVDFDGRRPIAVQRAVFRHLAFDESGRLDEHEWQKYDQLFVQTWPRIDELDQPHITDARAERAYEQIDRQFGWEPTPALRDQLYHAALHNKLVGGYLH